MRFGSVCSGIEAASVAWHALGWRAAFMSEIEAFPRAVLKHHYPDVTLHGDFTTIEADQYEPIDLLVGGTPCQSFSVAGLRGGLADDRGNLALEFLRLAQRLRPKWLVWENVPGVLSSNAGRDFGSILGGMVQLGYGIAWRVLDAQFFGVPQRRRRVFVVGCFGDWRGAAAVLFERHSLQGHPAPRREARESVAETIGGSSQSSGFRTTDLDNSGAFVPVQANTLMSFKHGPDPLDETLVAHSLRGQAQSSHRADSDTYVPVAYGGNRTSGPIDVTPALLAQPGSGYRCDFESETLITDSLRGDGQIAGALAAETGMKQQTYLAFQSSQFGVRTGETQATLDANTGSRRQNSIASATAVRRLTPRKCERLQGFPDDYTAIPWRGKPAADCPDGPRYKALGNSMAVPVMRWIGERIAQVELCHAA